MGSNVGKDRWKFALKKDKDKGRHFEFGVENFFQFPATDVFEE